MKKIIISLLIIFISATSFAHSGRTDASGCHNDKKRGTRHCH